ncbi:hypothetical protein NM208_g5842 [Fusarium decemcellulare]|uniref:Uncharacterized protein n=1 Tax=Fusarium decemcellulare TaxID=57161 RepID=A0ACC1SFS6_9HYPO|nr:hypothetical protein NM208_g5842 [Fusarium decemcellulare]
MEDTLQPALEAIARWATHTHDAFDLKLGHIQGPPATAKGIKVPPGISQGISRLMPEMKVFHVVPGFKKDQVEGERAANRRNTSAPIGSKAVIILDADPDYSADFALALTAAASFAESATAQDDNAAMRVVTLSWEGIHQLTKRLFGQWGVPREFTLSSVNRKNPKWIKTRPEDDVEAVLNGYANRVSARGRHTVMSFGPPPPDRVTWPSLEFSLGLFEQLIRQFPHATDRVTHILTRSDRAPALLEGCEIGHIIVNETSRRPIFDLETRQVVTVAVTASTSERNQQWNWAHRTDSAVSYVYSPEHFLQGDNANRPRRMDILNSQVDGFLVGLTAFSTWPDSFTSLLRLVASPGDDVLADMVQRLSLQRVITYNDSVLGFSLALPPPVHGLFYEVLPLVRYDSRVARLACSPSRTPLLGLAKLQLAVVLTYGMYDMFELENGLNSERGKYIHTFSQGFLRGLSDYGTAWMALGLMKAIMSPRMVPSLRGEQMITVSNGLITILVASVRKAHALYTTFLEMWQRAGMPVAQPQADTVGAEPTHRISTDEVHELFLDLVRAYAHQITIVRFKENWWPQVEDFLSGQIFVCDKTLRHTIAWDEIQKDNGDCAVGFYTKAVRRGNETVILDWNWIPDRVWRMYGHELEHVDRDGIMALQTRRPLVPNEDEA